MIAAGAPAITRNPGISEIDPAKVPVRRLSVGTARGSYRKLGMAPEQQAIADSSGSQRHRQQGLIAGHGFINIFLEPAFSLNRCSRRWPPDVTRRSQLVELSSTTRAQCRLEKRYVDRSTIVATKRAHAVL